MPQPYAVFHSEISTLVMVAAAPVNELPVISILPIPPVIVAVTPAPTKLMVDAVPTLLPSS